MDVAASFASALLQWGEGQRADLPWRGTCDPWAVLVSETMLQQTGVERVALRYQSFLRAFPTAAACAASSRGAVIRRWDGLGYYRRAVRLHEAAKRIVEQHEGRVPDRLEALLDLPGVGPYTARAILSLAFGHDVGVVDTNAARVLARAVAGRPLGRVEAQDLSDRQVPRGQAGAWNQAMMDLGATVCTKQRPRCDGCPVVAACRWALNGFTPPDPVDGTAGVSAPQPRFDGSDRQGRGRLLQALRTRPIPIAYTPDAAGWPGDPARAHRVAEGLVRDGLAVTTDGVLELPA